MSDRFPSSTPASGGNGDGVRTYRGRTIEELIPRIRAELGPDAIILREREGLTGGIGGFFAQRCVEIDAQAATRVSMYDDDLDDAEYEDYEEDEEDEIVGSVDEPPVLAPPPAPAPVAPAAPASAASEAALSPVRELPAAVPPPPAPVSGAPAAVPPPPAPVSGAPAAVPPVPAPEPARAAGGRPLFLDEASFAARLEEATFTTDEIMASEPPPAPRPAAPATTPLFIPFDELEEPVGASQAEAEPQSEPQSEPELESAPDVEAETPAEPEAESVPEMDWTEQATVEIAAATATLPEPDEAPAAGEADAEWVTEEPAPAREPLAPAPWLAFAEQDAAAPPLNMPDNTPPPAARSGAPVPQFGLPVTSAEPPAPTPQAPPAPAPDPAAPARYLARGVRRRSGILPAAERMLRAALDAAVAANERRELDYQALLAARQAAQPPYQPAPPGYQPAPPGYQQAPPGYQPAPPGYQQAPPGYQPAPPGYQQAPAGYQPGPAASEPAPPAGLLPAPATPAPAPADPGAGEADERARVRHQEHARDTELERRLVASGLSRPRAAALVSASISLRGPFSTGGELADVVRATIATALPTPRQLPAGHGAVAIVGAGGSGKTRCVAALATAYARAGSLVSVASLGSPGREDELGELLHGEAVNIIPAMRTRATARAVTSARERGLVIIDTAPVTPGDGSTIDVIAEALRSFSLDGTYLAVPATLSSPAGAKLIDGFSAFDLTGLVTTHVDETDQLGVIVELSMLTGIPLSYTHTGLDLQNAIAPADPEQIAAALLR